ncbi:hypothetical protein BH18CHL2_BH18CHL2_08110 [soil metagenome]
MLTVPQVARRTGRDPETIRRWIRGGKLRATKIGTQHVIDENDLEAVLERGRSLRVPDGWKRFESGRRQPDWVLAVERSRRGR